MDIVTLGIDLAKNVFQLHGTNKEGKMLLRKRLSRSELPSFVAQLSPCLIGIEACGSSHYWARLFVSFGHTVKMMSPQFVKPYVKSNKNDQNDAEAICEAVTRPNMRFVSIKTIEQQDMQALHRVRSQLIKNRTALANQIRGLLSEYGIIFPQQIQNVRKNLPTIIDEQNNNLSDLAKNLFSKLYEDFVSLDKRIEDTDKQINALFKTNSACQQIARVPGIGVLGATALISAIGDPSTFKSGRELSAWLGLVPRQSSSGNKNHLLGISKRGNIYLRSLLVHGARSALYHAKNKNDKRSSLDMWFTRT
ncbi:MAG: transposase [Francisellaceae bacterium]|nr:transposase [Francisellaceae bacterium]